ncbi:hypothetical protein O181_111193 [Austropuccinia psidii MF-1]|uniref:Uncharacterized protein n=1 Tax=Austropuccinia psidii MF-1 TaxID=1389203 RepID=A0A9Q3JY31_9BASI|nr:hypothetical protein [Austropuccinia psidii MF-1]
MKTPDKHMVRWKIAIQEWALLITPDHPAYVPENSEPQIQIEGIDITDVGTGFFEECTLIPTFELAYKTSIHSSTGKTPAMFEKGWNPKLPVDTLKKDLVDIHPPASSFKLLLDKLRHHSNQSMTDSFEYSKQKWDKSHKAPQFKVEDLILVSNLNFNNFKGPNKLKDSFLKPFIIKPLHGTNAVQE